MNFLQSEFKKKQEPKLIIKSFPTDVRKKRVSRSHHEQLFRQFGTARGNYLLKALIWDIEKKDEKIKSKKDRPAASFCGPTQNGADDVSF